MKINNFKKEFKTTEKVSPQRNYIVVTTMFLMLLSLFQSEIGMSQNFVISNMYYEPFPVEPGKEFNIWFKIDNLNREEISNITISFDDTFPFYLIEEDKRSLSVANLPGKESVLFSYRVKVDSRATEGNNQLKIKVKYGSNPFITYTFDVFVQPQKPTLQLIRFITEPEEISPGDEFDLRLSLQNSQEYSLKNLKVSLNLTNLPLSPRESSNYKTYSTVRANEQIQIPFTLISDPEASPGIYNLPIKIEYQDNLNNVYQESAVIGLIIKDIFDESVDALLDYSKLSYGESGTVGIRLVNKGLSKVKAASIEILESEDYEILENKKEYIGTIQPDDYESAEFTIIPKKDGKINVLFRYEYLNYINELKEEEKTISVLVKPAVERVSRSNNGLIIFIVIILIVLIVIWNRRRTRKPKK